MKIKCSPCEYGINDPRTITVVVQFLDVRHLSNQFCFHRRHHSLLVIEIKQKLWVPKNGNVFVRFSSFIVSRCVAFPRSREIEAKS